MNLDRCPKVPLTARKAGKLKVLDFVFVGEELQMKVEHHSSCRKKCFFFFSFFLGPGDHHSCSSIVVK